MTNYRLVAEWYHETTKKYFDSFKWVKDLTPQQMVAHKVSQQMNVDCHNGYLGGIFQKLVKAKPYRLQHIRYHEISAEIRSDDTNRKNTSSVPKGVILRRLSTVKHDSESRHAPQGRETYEVTGTLFYSSGADTLKSLAKIKKNEFPFIHPWYWAVPTVDQILTVMSFSDKDSLSELVSIYETEHSKSTVQKAVEKGVAKFKAKCEKPTPKEEPKCNTDAIAEYIEWRNAIYGSSDIFTSPLERRTPF